MEIMTQLLVENTIDVPYFAKIWERKQEDGKPTHGLCDWDKSIFHISISYVYIYYLHFYISASETSIPSLEETPNSSPKFPPETSHFLLVLDVSSENSFPLH